MKVDWGTKICGIPIIRIRDLFRALVDREFNAGAIRDRLKLDDQKSEVLVAEFLRRGWIEQIPRPSARIAWFCLTDDSISLAAAKAIRRITRAKAEQLLRDFMKRVHDVNDSDDFGVFVSDVYVFGSFLDPSANDLGDLDLAVSLHDRPIIGRQISRYEHERQEALGVDGWFSDFLVHEVNRYLKARQAHLSMHGVLRTKAAKIKMKLIFRAPKSERSPRKHRGKLERR